MAGWGTGLREHGKTQTRDTRTRRSPTVGEHHACGREGRDVMWTAVHRERAVGHCALCSWPVPSGRRRRVWGLWAGGPGSFW